MTLSDSQVRAWIDSMVGWHGPEDGMTPNSPVAAAFLRGAFLGDGFIPTYAPLSTLKHDKNLMAFKQFLWAAFKCMSEAGIGEEEVRVYNSGCGC